MINPETVFQDKRAQLFADIKGKPLIQIFDREDPNGINGISYVLGTQDSYVLLRWKSDDGTIEHVRAVTLEGNETESDQVARVLGHDTTAQALAYEGTVDKEEALDKALWYLSEYGNTQFEEAKQANDEIAGVLQTSRGNVLITGVGAAIFGSHIRAMQERGEADFREF
jgi:hypothetical protein